MNNNKKYLTYRDLIQGKIYECFDCNSCRALTWFAEVDNKKTEVVASSTFIFLGVTSNKNNISGYQTITIKGLVDGKLLYATECSTSFRYEEIENFFI